MTEKRYGVWITQDQAIRYGPETATWREAAESRGNEPEFFIWDHSTTPPTDVTDADPEAVKRWRCIWNAMAGTYTTAPTNSENYSATADWGVNNKLEIVIHIITSPTAPTFAEFRAAVKARPASRFRSPRSRAGGNGWCHMTGLQQASAAIWSRYGKTEKSNIASSAPPLTATPRPKRSTRPPWPLAKAVRCDRYGRVRDRHRPAERGGLGCYVERQEGEVDGLHGDPGRQILRRGTNNIRSMPIMDRVRDSRGQLTA